MKNAKASFASSQVGRRLRSVKKVSAAEVERDLLADAGNESAWEAPIRVHPRTSGVRGGSEKTSSPASGQHHETSEFQIIGEMAVWFANLESFLEVSISQLVASDDEHRGQLMRAVTAEMSFDRKVHAFSSLFKLRFPEESDDPQLSALVKELVIVQEERNAIFHSAWSRSADESLSARMKASVKMKRGLTTRVCLMSPDRLAAIRDHIGDVGQRFLRFAVERVEDRVTTAELPDSA